ncbi:hypothetical protein NDU88_007480 [Pleurodeles waltl]|uniref:Uncharacterized protein n=1 Tax=Pleurodeles waltl TaxID=8319 RepID=A0AAV7N5H5_PLEWA|nr:hypothetical protein NDU88_007480 [Pleurodeles waltl]
MMALVAFSWLWRTCTVQAYRHPRRTLGPSLPESKNWVGWHAFSSVTSPQLQNTLGYPMSKGLGDDDILGEMRQSPTKPCCNGSMRKVEDVIREEQQFLIEALVDENKEGEVMYQFSISETDSEKHQSKNDTESDLEMEEKDGIIMLKDPVPDNASDGKAVVNEETLAVNDVVNGDLANGAPETKKKKQ